jgi:hypothetical protein
LDTPTLIPFYQDWKFWSFFVSGTAVVLSQLPPIRILIRPKRLDVEVHNRVFVTHKVGNPNFGIHVSLGNSGGRNLRIKGLTVNIQKDGKELVSMSAQNYFESPTDNTSVLFVPFTLKPDEYWSHTVSFWNLFDRATEKLYRENETFLKLNIQKKLRERPEHIKDPVTADDSLVKPFNDLFEKLFIWEPGEYIFELVIESFPSSTSFKKMYRFTLFESDTTALKEHLKDYRYGGGLVYNIDSHVGLFIPISEHHV